MVLCLGNDSDKYQSILSDAISCVICSLSSKSNNEGFHFVVLSAMFNFKSCSLCGGISLSGKFSKVVVDEFKFEFEFEYNKCGGISLLDGLVYDAVG